MTVEFVAVLAESELLAMSQTTQMLRYSEGHEPIPVVEPEGVTNEKVAG